MRALLFDGWIYGADCDELGCAGIYFSTGGRDTGERTPDGRRMFVPAGMVCDEGDAAIPPHDADIDAGEEVELLLA
jgi:hypothetical protein